MNSLRTREGTQRRSREGGREAHRVRSRWLTAAGPGGGGGACKGSTHMGHGDLTGRNQRVQGAVTREGKRRARELGGREGGKAEGTGPGAEGRGWQGAPFLPRAQPGPLSVRSGLGPVPSAVTCVR